MGPKLEQANDESLCRRRREDRWLLEEEAALALEGRIARELPLLRHGESDASGIASLYLDRPDGTLTARAIRSPHDCMKVRVRAYFTADGRLGDLVFEIKRHRRGATRKWRVRADREALAEICAGRLDEVRPEDRGPLRRLLQGGALQPVVAVSYSRRVYQADEDLRVTFDRDVSWHAPPAALEEALALLAGGALPAPHGRLGQVVVELKQVSGPTPMSLAGALSGEARARSFSKFVAALRSGADRTATGNVA